MPAGLREVETSALREKQKRASLHSRDTAVTSEAVPRVELEGT